MTDEDISNSIDNVSLDMFQDMEKRFDEFTEKNKNEPNIIYLNNTGSGYYVSLAKFKDMRARYKKWKKDNNKEPSIIYINKGDSLEPITNYSKAFDDAVGKTTTTFNEICASLIGRGYLKYYNDKYSQKDALERLKKKQGLNCSDISQLVYQKLKDEGYTVEYVHVMCVRDGGHIQLRVKGKDLGSDWQRIDPSAALNGTNCRSIWCSNGSVVGYNPGWLMVDNGVT